MQALNEKLRQINAELRRQREAQESILSAVGLGAAEPTGPAAAAGDGTSSGPGPADAAAGAAAAAEGADPGAASEGEVVSEGEGGISGVQAAAALEALRRQAELLQRERAALEAALASPSAAHPTEFYGDQRLSIARARRQIAHCIRWVSRGHGQGWCAEMLANIAFLAHCASWTVVIQAHHQDSWWPAWAGQGVQVQHAALV